MRAALTDMLTESGLALEALLELLELANFWQLEELKIQAIKALVELQLVRAETCDDSKCYDHYFMPRDRLTNYFC